MGLHPDRVLAKRVLVADGIIDQAGVPLHHGRTTQHVPLALLASATSGAG